MKNNKAIRNYSEQIKAILVGLAVNDKLPLDMTELDANVFGSVFEPLVTTLDTLRLDANMALTGEWDKSDEGFEAQIASINQVIGTK